MPQLPTSALRDPSIHAHRYDLPRDAFVLRRVPRAAHAAAAFLTDEYLGPATGEPDWVARSQAETLEEGGPLHFIFHSAFCNSTLLVRALDHAGLAMGLSEPVVLNDLVGLRRRGEIDNAGLADRCRASLRLLGRPWDAGEAVVIKPSNIVNGLAAGLLALRPEARALVVHTELKLFLASVARKGLWARLWVRQLAEGFFRDGVVQPLGFAPDDLARLTDLQVAALGWLAQQRIFAMLAKGCQPGRVRGLAAEQLTPEPGLMLDAVANHFGLSAEPALRAALAEAPALRRHSKSGESFDMAARRSEQLRALELHGAEIEAVLTWSQACADQAGISMELPDPL